MRDLVVVTPEIRIPNGIGSRFIVTELKSNTSTKGQKPYHVPNCCCFLST